MPKTKRRPYHRPRGRAEAKRFPGTRRQRLVAAGAGLLLAAGGATAVLEAGSGTPAPELPNGTLEQIAHNSGYQSEVGKLALKNSFRETFPPGLGQTQPQHMDVYNFTHSEISPAFMKRLVDYLRQYIIDSKKTLQVPIITGIHVDNKGNISDKTQMITIHAEPTGANWHDEIVWPASVRSPKGLPKDSDSTMPLDIKGKANLVTVPEEISVLHTPTAANSKGNIPFYNLQTESKALRTSSKGDLPFSSLLDGVVTETLQNWVRWKIDPDTVVPGYSKGRLGLDAQEIGNNGLANGIGAALRGLPYEEYVKANSHYVNVWGAGGFVNIPALSGPDYNAALVYFNDFATGA